MLLTLVFIISALGTLGGGLGVVISPKPMASLFSMLIMFFFMGALFVLQSATTIAAMNIIVYAGAIMVLFLFVIMLLNLKTFDTPSPLVTQGFLGIATGLIVTVQIWAALKVSTGIKVTGEFPADKVQEMGNMQALSMVLLRDYLYPFEIISVFLLASMVGVMGLLKRNRLMKGEPAE